jgi:hypothetical protein
LGPSPFSDRKPIGRALNRLARTLAAHLLDLGYHASHLLTWAERLGHQRATVANLVEDAAELARAPRQSYRVLVPLVATPRRELAEGLDTWLSKGAVISWLKQRGHDTSGLRVGGGFLYEMIARDPYGAADQARQLLDRMIARSSFLRRSRDGIRPTEHIWVDGHSQPVAVAGPARGADIISLVHEGHLYKVDGARQRIDDALELAAPVNRGAVGPAVAGAWAAIESLLSHPDDPSEAERSGKAVAADRLAAIIACSWPRAELTALAHRHNPAEPDELAAQLAKCRVNRERAQLVAAAILADSGLPDLSHSRNRHSDLAAARRMRKLLANPRRELDDAANRFRIAMRRLYRTRNIVLHGGSVQSVTLHAALRTAAPLVGAGLDRITHAATTGGWTRSTWRPGPNWRCASSVGRLASHQSTCWNRRIRRTRHRKRGSGHLIARRVPLQSCDQDTPHHPRTYRRQSKIPCSAVRAAVRWSAIREASVAWARSGGSSSANLSWRTACSSTAGWTPPRSTP